MARQVTLDDKYALDSTRAYITGIEALVRLPMLQSQRDRERGLNTAGFISGYRGSPLGGVDQQLWKAKNYLEKYDIQFQPGINEDLAATAVWGSQQVNLLDGAKYDGVFGMWYGKGPGVDRSMDVIKHANAAGTSKFGGVLAIAGDDHACKSSTLPHQSEHMFMGASIPVLCPANVQEVLDLGIYGWELSRYCGTWVALKAITENMDSAISAEIDPNRIKIEIPEGFELPESGVHIRWPDPGIEQEQRLNKYKIYAAREFARVNKLNKIVINSDKPRVGILTTGKSYLDVMQALEDLHISQEQASELGIRVLKMGMSWPMEPSIVHEFAEGLDEIIVVEEKRSIMEDQLTGQLYNWPVDTRPTVIGEFDEKGDDLLPNLTELTPAMIARVIAKRIAPFYANETIAERLQFFNDKEAFLASERKLAKRTPHYCSGCPHNTSTQVPEGEVALGGIGCHYMGTWMEGARTAHTYTQMGGEGVTWVGQAGFTDRKHVFQNLGDGTYFHSGSLAIRQSVVAGVNITYKILFNDAVAMTGGQPVEGELTLEQTMRQVLSENIAKLVVVSDDPDLIRSEVTKLGVSLYHRDELMDVQRQLSEVEGTSVLIYQQVCAAEKRRRRRIGKMEEPTKRLAINSDVCEGCGDCGVASNCLSVQPLETELGRKRTIDQNSCNKDYSCVKGFCPSFVEVDGASLVKEATELPEITGDLVAPELPSLHQPWNIVVAGIGGTGVLTVNAIVAMAAHIEGKGCATLNQTGLAQKYGAVVCHVRVGETQQSINAVRIAAGDADLLIGCDLAVAASEEPLAKVYRKRSHAVLNTHASSTPAFLSNPDVEYPSEDMVAAVVDQVGGAKTHCLDASTLATKLFGESMASNLFLLGYAYQQGLIPLSAESITEAIRLNGRSIKMNQDAFNWGRMAQIDLQRVAVVAGVAGVQEFAPLQSLTAVVDDRAERLTEYQNQAYANDYRAAVNEFVVKADEASMSESVQVQFARNLYKLMAYKDEYEVARLYSSPNFKAQLEAQFAGDYKLAFHLAPPLIAPLNKRTGLPRKIRFGSYMLPVFNVLAKFKGLRGTAFDLFGYTDERKREREMIGEYQRIVFKALELVTEDNKELIEQVIMAASQIRGFGHVKHENEKRVKLLWDSLISRLEMGDTHVVKFVEPV